MLTSIAIGVVVFVTSFTFFLYVLKAGPFKKEDKVAEHMKDGSDHMARAMADLVLDGVTDKLQTIAEYDDLAYRKGQMDGHIVELKAEIKALTKDKTVIEDDFKRQRRELEHEVGLREKQLEHELQTGQERADLAAEKKILAAEKGFNEKALAQAKAAFDKQLESSEKSVERLAKLVPNLEASLKVVRKDG